MPRSLAQKIVARLTVDENGEVAHRHGKDPLDPFLSIARWLPRSMSPFIDLEIILDVGVGKSGKQPDPLDIERYNAIMELHPEFSALILAFKGASEEYESFISEMSKAMREARAQDTNSIKRLIGSFLPLDPIKNPLTPAIAPDAKASRGWVHIGTAAALVPLKDKVLFERDPFDYMKKAEDGKIKLRASNLPTFLYEHGTIYDPNEPDKGLFRSHIIIRALRLFYTGESSVLTGHRAVAKPSQAELHGMRTVTPQAVGYAACQVYVSLSALQHWGRFDGYFDIESLYDICVQLFTADPNDLWATETLKYLTDQLPTLKRKRKSRGAILEDSDDEAVDKDDPTGILAIRARRARENNSPTAPEHEHEQHAHSPEADPPRLPSPEHHHASPSRNRSNSPVPHQQPPPPSPRPHSPDRSPSPPPTNSRALRTRRQNIPSDDEDEREVAAPVKIHKGSRGYGAKSKRKKFN